jgi:superfamily II RNA helicase
MLTLNIKKNTADLNSCKRRKGEVTLRIAHDDRLAQVDDLQSIEEIHMIPSGIALDQGVWVPGKYRGLKLDPFQKKAIHAVASGFSTIVSAPTGVGKTLIADYLVEMTSAQSKQVIYTAPIKALSSQKYKDFKAIFGEDAVGIMTGDVVINRDAPVLVMTTEILRNIIFAEPERLDDVSWVIFDEIHYLGDEDRGHVWEQCIILLPSHIRILGLSATVPNAEELGRWIYEVRQIPVVVIRRTKRPVPLAHLYFEGTSGLSSRKQLERNWDKLEEKYYNDANWGYFAKPTTDFKDLVLGLNPASYFPCLYFVFSRRACERYAEAISYTQSYLTSEEAERAEGLLDAKAEAYRLRGTKDYQLLKATVPKGVAFHHAGLLPVFKDLVEDLFKERLIQVLFATETFSLGVNYPVKTACFDAPSKYDGKTFRFLKAQEYFQMAGRAGRRGIDRKGYVITLVNFSYTNPYELPRYDEDNVEPLTSKFALTYNSVLNLTDSFSQVQVREILSKNFATFRNREEVTIMRKEMTGIERELKELRPLYCPVRGQTNCPKVHARLQRRIANLERAVKRGPQKKSRAAKRKWVENQRKLELLKSQISGVVVRTCNRVGEKECAPVNKRYERLLKRLNTLENAYEKMAPTDVCVDEYWRKRHFLEELKYIEKDGVLTDRGKFAKNVYIQEILVTELLFEGIFHDLTSDEINALAVCIDHEARRTGGPKKKATRGPWNSQRILRTVVWLENMEKRRFGSSTILFSDELGELAYRWSLGESFNDIIQGTDVDEGDIVLGFRRGVDLLRQLRNAVKGEDEILYDKLGAAMGKLSRDIVAVEL